MYYRWKTCNTLKTRWSLKYPLSNLSSSMSTVCTINPFLVARMNYASMTTNMSYKVVTPLAAVICTALCKHTETRMIDDYNVYNALQTRQCMRHRCRGSRQTIWNRSWNSILGIVSSLRCVYVLKFENLQK